MKKLLFLLATVGIIFTACEGCFDNDDKGFSAESKNVILYTSSNGRIVTPYNSDVFGANIISNTYKNGQGILMFDAPVTLIGYWAFRGCGSLTSITIPNSVIEIGKYAFQNCDSLTSVAIGDSVTSIGICAFQYCPSLTSVTIPDSVTLIGDNAFNDCTALTRVNISNLSAWCKISFGGRLANPLCHDAKLYLNGRELTNITIPSDVTRIESWALYGCNSLTSVTIPDSVTSIGDGAFSSCHSLKAFKGKFALSDNSCLIVDGVLNSFAIGCGATKYTIPNSVTSIGEYAFYKCKSLTSVTIPDSVTSIGNSAFYGCTGELMVNCNIPSASEFKYGAFYGTKFTKVTIGNSVTLIGDYAFRDCTALTSVTIPDSVTSIGSGAFSGCTALTSVTIPNSVTSIGEGAFYKCTSLTSVYCKPITPPSLGRSAFSGANITKIYVPRNSVEAYKAEYRWSVYASYIEGYDF